MISWLDLWTPGAWSWLADKVEPWLPPWLGYVVAAPFGAIVVITAGIEWLIRSLITPAKFVKRS